MISSTNKPARRAVTLVAFGVLTFLAGCHFDWEPLFHERVEAEELRSLAIATTTDALTFAREHIDGAPPRLLAVTRYQDDAVEAVDLGAALGDPSLHDPIEAFNRYGYATLQDAIERTTARETISVTRLGLPLDLHNHHIAAGTNFPEHADEAGVSEGPFLFAKLVQPTAFDAIVPARKALLDYEVELAWVPLEPLTRGAEPQFMGLLLCNDFTDRDVLLRHLDTGDVASGKGFTTGKSFPAYLPVSNLFVIPKDYRRFAAETILRLYVNRWLRQREAVSRAVWDIDRIIAESWTREQTTWAHQGEQVSLFRTPGQIDARTLIMSGTPPGTVFNALTVEQMAGGFFDFMAFGWGSSIPQHAIENYIYDARAAGIYLHPEDEVVIHVERLGVLRNRVQR
jgi:2,4-diketo-3-deoxy-L-fuconate hydrolase